MLRVDALVLDLDQMDHRGIDPFDFAFANLNLARAYALQKDTAKARAKYQDFLALWRDADPDTPMLKQAKSEYAKLQSRGNSK